jgi:hypothetical protein
MRLRTEFFNTNAIFHQLANEGNTATVSPELLEEAFRG